MKLIEGETLCEACNKYQRFMITEEQRLNFSFYFTRGVICKNCGKSSWKIGAFRTAPIVSCE